ncbi:MAG: DUF7507 domain-containing protein, partial [Candidatus Hydrogenedentales bacterium]
NTGNVSLTDIVVTDALLGLSESIPSLGVGASESFTETYTITQADLDAGSVLNSASASGKDPDDNPVDDDDEVTVEAEQQASLSVDKSASPLTYDAVGDVITYTITVTNTGNVSLTDVVVTDALLGLSESIPSLGVGASESFTESYTITQADLDAGSVLNSASASGNDPDDNPVDDDDDVTVEAGHNAQLQVEKSAEPTQYSSVGDVISYTITVTNAGNVTLFDVALVDPLTALSESIASLAPRSVATYTATYTITQDDLDAGSVTNTVTASAHDSDDESVHDTANEMVSAIKDAALDVVKTAAPSTYSAVDEVITYTITVMNAGNVTLSDVVATDGLLGLSETIGVMAPGASESFTESYTITQADLDAGSVLNTASAVGNDPQGEAVHDDDSVEVFGDILTGQDTSFGPVYCLGDPEVANVFDSIRLNGVPVNPSDVVLTIVNAQPNKADGLGPEIDPITGILSVPERTTPGIYEIYYQVCEIAHPTNCVTAKISVEVQRRIAALSVSSSVSSPEQAAVGDSVDFTITVTNTGDVEVVNIVATDSLSALNEHIDSLQPGESKHITTHYVLQQADVDRGSLKNEVSAVAESIEPVICEDQTTTYSAVQVNIKQRPALKLSKEAAPTSYNAVGDIISYTILVENTGNVALTQVVVSDPLTGLNSTIANLAAGASESFSESYTITQSDLDSGSVSNTASAVGKDPKGDSVEAHDEAVVVVDEEVLNADVSVTKTADVESYRNAGDVITYTVTVTNTGVVTLSDVKVTDPLTGLDEILASLAPGESKEFTETYTVIEDDVASGSILNTATVIGSAPDGSFVSDDAELIIQAEEPGCCEGFDILDPANIFLGILALLTLVLLSLFVGMGGGLPTKI